jgi:colicin import membrane protein
MINRTSSAGPGLGASFAVSTVIHLTVFLLLFWYGSHMKPMTVVETYYVDIVNLPVAAPQSGSPSQQGNDREAAPPPTNPVSPMSLPQARDRSIKTAPKQNERNSGKEDPSFADRLSKLREKAEAREQEAALERLRSKVTSPGSGKAGMPSSKGTEAGSDYTAFIQSRLKDAFRETISFSSKNPEVVARIFIDSDGKVSRRKIERSSSDRAFEISVIRAIEMASEKFTPPPNRKIFEGVFVFKPQGISQNKP